MSDECISPLRRRMIEDMTVRKFCRTAAERSWSQGALPGAPAGPRRRQRLVDAGNSPRKAKWSWGGLCGVGHTRRSRCWRANWNRCCDRTDVRNPQVPVRCDLWPICHSKPQGGSISSNIARRHMSKGQQATAVAMMYPEPAKGSGSLESEELGISGARLYRAGIDDRWCAPQLAHDAHKHHLR